MLELHPLILYNFLHMAKLSNILILHCWPLDCEWFSEVIP